MILNLLGPDRSIRVVLTVLIGDVLVEKRGILVLINIAILVVVHLGDEAGQSITENITF